MLNLKLIQQDIYAIRRADAGKVFIVYDNSNAVFNLTGYTVSCIAREYEGSDAILTLTTSVIAASGQITVSVSPSLIFTKPRYFYEIVITGSGNVARVACGQMLVE